MLRAACAHALSEPMHVRLGSVATVFLAYTRSERSEAVTGLRRCHNNKSSSCMNEAAPTTPPPTPPTLATGTPTANYAVLRWDNNVVTVPFVGDETRARTLAARMTSENHKSHVFVRRCQSSTLPPGTPVCHCTAVASLAARLLCMRRPRLLAFAMTYAPTGCAPTTLAVY
jgi:hypothetical protein